MISNLWPTPFLQSKIDPNICEELVTHLSQNYDFGCPPREDSNLLEDGSSIMQRFKSEVVLPSFNNFLRNTINKELSDWSGFKAKAWLIGTSKNYSINYHNHRGAQLSAVFYLMCEEGVGGDISFTDPRQNSNRGYDESFIPWFKDLKLSPKSGDLVVFPSFLYHHVSTYSGNIRLALPVDLYLYNSN